LFSRYAWIRFLAAPLAALAILASTSGAGAAATPLPKSMAALGDSITRGFNACGFFFDCTALSWSTGTDTKVDSHYLRLLALQPKISGKNYNDARSGAKMADLNGQALAAVSQHVQYVTILMGANDACTSSVGTMTSTADFQAQFQQALKTLAAGLPPKSPIFVASIPNVYHLWEIGHNDLQVVATWDALKICQSMLANPTSMNYPDVQRRQQVLDQIKAYNNVLGMLCGQLANCKFDGGAVYDYQFGLNLLSTWDYFHPNETGQATLASVTWSVVKAVWGLTW
jgi:lysophospholipase L1-like esterase